MSDASVAREAPDDEPDARAIDVAEAADASAEAPKEQPDDDDDNTGFLERIRGAGKRLVG